VQRCASIVLCGAIAVAALVGVEARAGAWDEAVHFRASWFKLKHWVPADAFICYPAQAGLYVVHYDPNFVNESVARVPRQEAAFVAVKPVRDVPAEWRVQHLEGVSLMDWASACCVPIPHVTTATLPELPNLMCARLTVKSLSEAATGSGPILAVIPPTDPHTLVEALGRLSQNGETAGQWAVLNPYLPPEPVRTLVLVYTGQNPAPASLAVLDADALVRLYRLVAH
jgi:hypothetical protein